jgi:outer membrane lipoprotein SlyB
MKKILFATAVAISLVGCASNDRYQNRADSERERQAGYAERAVSQAPKWMSNLPQSKDAVYANGTATSPDMSMAADKAKLVALGKICMAAGGVVDQRNTMFRTDTGDASVEKSELAIRGMCQKVDISGVEVAEVKTIAEGNRFRTYVLVALPTGDANAIQKRKDQIRTQESARQRGEQVFREMDSAPAATNQ